VIYSTIAALILRSVSAELRGRIMGELRSSISVSAQGVLKPSDAELMTLEIEEQAQQLLDQIERMARLEFWWWSISPGRPPTFRIRKPSKMVIPHSPPDLSISLARRAKVRHDRRSTSTGKCQGQASMGCPPNGG
jgi:hypothetical protein